MKEILYAFIILLIPFYGFSQSPHVVRFQVNSRDQNTPIEHAKMDIDVMQQSYETNQAGYLELALPTGYYKVTYFAESYGELEQQLMINSDTSLQVQLMPLSIILETVEIISSQIDDRINFLRPSVETVSMKQLEQVPAIGGEFDPVRYVSLLPGVQNSGEGSADLVVRGGGIDQNLMLLDNATIYHTDHFYGFLSPYNPKIIESVSLHKGAFPAQYGGRLSSVINATTINTHPDQFKLNASLGMISSNVTATIPIIDNRLSLLTSYRGTYLDKLQELFSKDQSHETFGFEEFYNKLYWSKGNHTAFISWYASGDRYKDLTQQRELEDRALLQQDWQNNLWTLNYQGQLSPTLSQSFNAFISNYEMSIFDEQEKSFEFYKSWFSSRIKEYNAKYLLEKTFSGELITNVGLELARFETSPSNVFNQDNDEAVSFQNIPDINYSYLAPFVDFSFDKEHLKASLGYRASIWPNQTIHEPRMSLGVFPKENMSIQASYSRMSQNLQLLTNPGLGYPVNLYISSAPNFNNSIADQWSIAYNSHFRKWERGFNLSIEAYYKQMKDILAYKDGFSSNVFTSANPIRQPELHEALAQGHGHSYGLEFSLTHNSNYWSAGLYYTLSWARHKFNDLNEGNPFWSPFDRRHVINAYLNTQLTPRIDFSISGSLASGLPYTLPTASFPALTPDFSTGKFTSIDNVIAQLYAQSDRNAYRMKNFFTVNAEVSYKLKKGSDKWILNFGVYNILNRSNPFYYEYDGRVAFSNNGTTDPLVYSQLDNVSVFPFLPYMSIRFKIGK